jgi:hypothetical protein
MNYLKAYCNLIRKAEKRGYTKKKAKEQGLYVEGHHTFPISIFGKNKRIVYLTAREHYIAHCLLEKIFLKRYGIKDWRTSKMIWAHIMMAGKNRAAEKTYFNSYLYEATRMRISQIEVTMETRQKQSRHHKKSKWWYKGEKTKFCKKCPGKGWKRGRPGINIGRKLSQKTKDKISISHTGKKQNKQVKEKTAKRSKNSVWWNDGRKNKFCQKHPGEGWVRGRGNYWNNGEKETMSIISPGSEWKRGRVPGILNGINTGLVYWNNGIENIKSKNSPGPEWKRGKLPEGTNWWNNGEKNIKSKECPGEEWVIGMIRKNKRDIRC